MATKNFNSVFEDTKKESSEETKKVTSVANIDALNIPPRPLGGSNLEIGDIFTIENINSNIWIDNTIKSKNPVYFTIVKMWDSGNNEVGAKRLYLNSLCKTVFKYYQDEFGNVLKDPKTFITTSGDVATDIQKGTNMIESLRTISNSGKKIVVTDKEIIITKNWNIDANNPNPLYTASCYVLDYVK